MSAPPTKVVIALGGNALLRRGQALSASTQLKNIRVAAAQLARIAAVHTLLLTHGNGPQVGLLALQSAAYPDVEVYPMDVLGAESQGMIGYLLEQEISNLLPPDRRAATLVTRVEVDANDAAFAKPTKPIGPVYRVDEAQRLAESRHWVIAANGAGFRRVVASPRPLRVLNLASIRALLDCGTLVIAAGGGGIPVVRQGIDPTFQGAEAVIDKDLCAALLASSLEVECLVLATDVDAVYLDWGTPEQRALGNITAEELSAYQFPAGSMGPKVEAALQFVRATGGRAAIGTLARLEDLLAGTTGTQVVNAG